MSPNTTVVLKSTHSCALPGGCVDLHDRRGFLRRDAANTNQLFTEHFLHREILQMCTHRLVNNRFTVGRSSSLSDIWPCFSLWFDVTLTHWLLSPCRTTRDCDDDDCTDQIFYDRALRCLWILNESRIQPSPILGLHPTMDEYEKTPERWNEMISPLS